MRCPLSRGRRAVANRLLVLSPYDLYRRLLGRRAPVVLWGGLAGDLQFGSPADRWRQVILGNRRARQEAMRRFGASMATMTAAHERLALAAAKALRDGIKPWIDAIEASRFPGGRP